LSALPCTAELIGACEVDPACVAQWLLRAGSRSWPGRRNGDCSWWGAWSFVTQAQGAGPRFAACQSLVPVLGGAGSLLAWCHVPHSRVVLVAPTLPLWCLRSGLFWVCLHECRVLQLTVCPGECLPISHALLHRIFCRAVARNCRLVASRRCTALSAAAVVTVQSRSGERCTDAGAVASMARAALGAALSSLLRRPAHGRGRIDSSQLASPAAATLLSGRLGSVSSSGSWLSPRRGAVSWASSILR